MRGKPAFWSMTDGLETFACKWHREEAERIRAGISELVHKHDVFLIDIRRMGARHYMLLPRYCNGVHPNCFLNKRMKYVVS